MNSFVTLFLLSFFSPVFCDYTSDYKAYVLAISMHISFFGVKICVIVVVFFIYMFILHSYYLCIYNSTHISNSSPIQRLKLQSYCQDFSLDIWPVCNFLNFESEKDFALCRTSYLVKYLLPYLKYCRVSLWISNC